VGVQDVLTLPKIVERPMQYYLGIRESVPMEGISTMADVNFPSLFRWIGEKEITRAGAPFFKYNIIDMAGLLELEVGIPLAAPVVGDELVVAGILPAGRYATLTYTGPYDNLMDANAVLVGWGRERGLVWDVEETFLGDQFGCRLEIYHTDPAAEPDTAKWVTEVLIRLADD